VLRSFPIPRGRGRCFSSEDWLILIGRISQWRGKSGMDSEFPDLCTKSLEITSSNRFLVRVAGWMQEYRKYTLANYTSMIRSNCQFLTNIATFSKVHYSPLNDDGQKIRQNDVHPPIISILDSIGKAFIGIMSVLPSGTPSAILCSR